MTACSTSAQTLGIAVGMPLGEAKTLVVGTEVHFEAHDPHADLAALHALAQWSQRFSPLVAVEEADAPSCLLLDVTGCAAVFGGEAKLLAKVHDDFRRLGYWVEVSLADTVGAAWALAHYAQRGDGGRRTADGDASPLASLPVAALRLSSSTLELLRQFDIHRIEQLLALSRKDWTRLDPEIVRRLDQARGHVPELLTYERTEEPVAFSWPFESPIRQRGILERVLEQQLGQILERLQPRQLGVRRLVCRIETETTPMDVAIELLQPSDSARHLMDLVRLHFERVRLPSAVAAVTLRADVIVPLEFEQSQLFESEAGAERWRSLPALIERLSQRLGEKSVLRPKLWPDAQPERACRYEPWLREKASPRSCPAPTFGRRVLERPPCLTRPIPITVATRVPDGPPDRFQWQGETHVIAHWWGPERIETGWWRHDDIRRDYYLVETSEGKRFWLYRAAPQGWRLHGTYG